MARILGIIVKCAFIAGLGSPGIAAAEDRVEKPCFAGDEPTERCRAAWQANADEALRRNDWKSAQNAAAVAFKFAEALDPGGLASARAALAIARTIAAEGRRDEAEQMFRETAQWMEMLGAEAAADLPQAVSFLAGILLERKKYDEAEAQYRRAIAFAEAAGVEDASTFNNYALLLQNSGRYHDSLTAYRKSFDIQQRATGRGSKEAAVSAIGLGQMLIETGDYVGATGVMRYALAVAEDDRNDLPAVMLLNALGHAYRRRTRAADALPLYREAVRRTQGWADPFMFDVSASGLGLTLDQLGLHAEAEPLFRRVVEHGKENPSGAALGNLAANLAVQGRHNDAATIFERTEAACIASFQDSDPSLTQCLGPVAQFHAMRGDLERATALYRHILDLDTSSYRPGHPDRVKDTWLLARLLSLQKPARFDEAWALCRMGMAEMVLRIGSLDALDEDAAREFVAVRPMYVLSVTTAWQLAAQEAM